MFGSANNTDVLNQSMSGKTDQSLFIYENNTTVPLNNDNVTTKSLIPIPPISAGLIQNISSFGSAPYVPDRIIVRYRNDSISSKSGLVSIEASMNAQVGASVLSNESVLGVSGLQVLQLPNNTSVSSAIAVYNSSPYVLYAEPDYIVSAYNDDQSQLTSPFPIDPDISTYRNRMNTLFHSPASNSTTGNAERTSSVFSDNHTQVQTKWPTEFEINGTMSVENSIEAWPNDPYYSSQWDMPKIDTTDAWQISTGSSSVIVAVVDTGVDYNHEDLAANCITGGTFMNGGQTIPGGMDDNGHGTHCAGTIAGIGNNGKGIAGVTWNSKIMPLKFLDSYGYGSTGDAITAIAYANSHGANIISCSWGGGGYSQSLHDVIAASSAVVVCAAGNGGADNVGDNNDVTPQYPSSYDCSNIIAVASTNSNDIRASSSNYGPTSVDLAAPGVGIYSTYLSSAYGGYVTMSGTSMATPHVSGVAALVKAVHPTYTSVQIISAICGGVDPISSMSGLCVTGGRLNAKRSISNHIFGSTGCQAVVGDWNNDEKDEIGVFYYGGWWLDNNGDYVWDAGDTYHVFGSPGCQAVVGDWNNDGKDEIGVFYYGGWWLDNNGDYVWDAGDTYQALGSIGFQPVVGDWNNDGKDEIGIFSNGGWWLN